MGAHAQAAALVPQQAGGPAELRWSGDDASGRWSLVARAGREATDPLDPGEAPPMPRAARLAALEAEKASGSLAFEAQRATGSRRWTAAFFASRAALATRDDLAARPLAAFDSFDSSRAQRTRYGTTLSLAGTSRGLGLSGDHFITLSFGGETRDSRTVSRDTSSGAESILQRSGLAETRLALDARQSFALPLGAALALGGRLERFHASADGLASAAFSGTRFVPSVTLDSPGLGAWRLFARARRGDEGTGTLAALDPWRLSSSGRPDPAMRRTFGEAGARARIGAIEASFSMWRADDAGEALAFGERGAVATAPGGARHGYALGLHYQPVRWLDLRGDVLLDLARGAEASALPGAPHVLGSADATMKMSRDWDAAVGVSYIGRRDGIDDPSTLSSAALVNGQLVRWFGRTTRISFHVFNALDHRIEAIDTFAASRLGWLDGTGESFLASPAEPRAFLLKFRTRF